MIAKKVNREGCDSFKKLALYLGAADDPGEKLDDLWMAGCATTGGVENLKIAIAEVEATQALNTRAKGDKTYHLVVSFRDEKPSPAALRDMEIEFAGALGLAEHQRIAATHRNTDNFHMHVAINKVHPVSGRMVTPFRDYRTLEKTCRAMEKKHGLKVDLGRKDKKERNPMPRAARDKEAHTWEKSFYSYVVDQKAVLTDSLAKARTWADLHQGFGRRGLVLRLRGNGLVIGDRPGRNHIKASSLGREFSKSPLEKRLGRFQGLQPGRDTKPVKRYRKEPTTKHPEQWRKWREYRSRGRSRKGPSLLASAYRHWRSFLMADALGDPLSMAIIYAQRKMIDALATGFSAPLRKPPAPPLAVKTAETKPEKKLAGSRKRPGKKPGRDLS